MQYALETIDKWGQSTADSFSHYQEIIDKELWRVAGFDTMTDCAQWVAQRFNLNKGQLAARAVEVLPAIEAEAKERQIRKPVDNSVKEFLPEQIPQARDTAGQMFGVSGRMVSDAKAIQKQSPETFEQVRRGSMSIQQAKAEVKDIRQERDAKAKASIIRNWYDLSTWEALSTNEQDALIKTSSNHKFNTTNDNVEWARYTWNPITGCLHNCTYCYARDIAARFYRHLPENDRFQPVFYPERLTAPNNTPQKDLTQFDNPVDQMGYKNVFVCSMADLFGKWVPEDWIEAVLTQIRNNPQWTFLLLSKFPIRMAEFDYPDNIWLGTTVDYRYAVERAEKAFTKIKQSGFNGVCWLSCEPMMERLTFNSLDMFDWLTMGGSSKSTQTPEYKPPFEDIVHLYNQAKQANCQVYFKTNLLGDRIREYPNL